MASGSSCRIVCTAQRSPVSLPYASTRVGVTDSRYPSRTSPASSGGACTPVSAWRTKCPSRAVREAGSGSRTDIGPAYGTRVKRRTRGVPLPHGADRAHPHPAAATARERGHRAGPGRHPGGDHPQRPVGRRAHRARPRSGGLGAAGRRGRGRPGRRPARQPRHLAYPARRARHQADRGAAAVARGRVRPVIYLDSCALVKLVSPAPETAALERYLRQHADEHHVASALVRTEVRRALHRIGATARQRATADKLLDVVVTISVSDELLDAAGHLTEPGLRSLDAIHLATALRLGTGLRDFVTYDRHLLAAAKSAGLATAAPR